MSRLTPILLLLSTWLLSFAGADDYVRVRLEAPGASPYSEIRYEITKRAPATTAVHRRMLPGHPESLHTLGLMTAEEAARIDALIASTDAMTLADAAPAKRRPGQLTWRVELMIDGVTHGLSVTAPQELRDRRYARLIDGVRDTVRAIAGELPFRNVFFSPDRRGWLNVVSVPAARLKVDGFDTQLDTPVYHYEVESGSHTLTLVSLDGKHERDYEVRIEPGGSTSLRVDLR